VGIPRFEVDFGGLNVKQLQIAVEVFLKKQIKVTSFHFLNEKHNLLFLLPLFRRIYPIQRKCQQKYPDLYELHLVYLIKVDRQKQLSDYF